MSRLIPPRPRFATGSGRWFCLTAQRDSDAATEFEKILKLRGVVQNQPIAPLARLGMARAYFMQGDTARAKSAYQHFLALWNDADSDIPILVQAKSKYAKLR